MKVNYDPPVEHGIKPRVHYVGVTTESENTYCTFGAEVIQVAPSPKYLLEAEIVGDKSIVSEYVWTCFLNETKPCHNFMDIQYDNDRGYAIDVPTYQYTRMELELIMYRDYRNKVVPFNKCMIVIESGDENVMEMELTNLKTHHKGNTYDPRD